MSVYQRREPTVWDKLKMGAMMGVGVGFCTGFVLGGFTVLSRGPGEHGYLGTVGRHMLQGAVWFGAIMSVGSVLRGEEAHPVSYPLQYNPPTAFSYVRPARIPVEIEQRCQ